MYQVHFQCGYEIQVIGKGENGLCRVEKATASGNHTAFTGTYAECERWLKDRGILAMSKAR